MRKILFIECCGECFYHKYRLKLNGYTCSHSKGSAEAKQDAREMPLWCPLQSADQVEGA